ncbi:MAG: MiaB/RimO family radical SAM methylthiotransferase [Gemmatimonadetes bacterium]|nr:MiaB/RimO family radical SAM methylthiotransferase [Gemmatimonadota bacterium]
MTVSAPRLTRAYVETYGCQMNVADGELMEGVLVSAGYEIVSSPHEADVVLVNTCAIRDHAERRVLGRVSQLNALKMERPGLVIGVTGCMAQRIGETLLEKAPYVDLVMGPDSYRSLPAHLDRLFTVAAELPSAPVRWGGTSAGEAGDGTRRRLQLAVLELDPREGYEGLEQRRTSGSSAWIPIQRGCDHRCTFCIVPYVRGSEKNRASGDVLDEVRRIADSGVTEITLLGQTVSSYQHDGWSFPRLLREVARVEGIRRVRFTSPHPNDVSDELIEVMATEPAVCEQLHLPAQSGNDRTLKRMVRRYTVGGFLGIVDKVRGALPDVALSTDVIVGFPGETEDEFEDTLELMRTIRFDDAFTYRYSLREGTPAARFPKGEFIPEIEAQRRLEELIRVAREIQAEINLGEVGRVDEVLLERQARNPGELLGRTRRNKVVALPAPGCDAGDYVLAELTGTRGGTFAGWPVGAPIAANWR